jgi:hypothetical protein
MGIVSTLSPLVLGVARRSPRAGRLAYNALATGVGATRTARSVAGGAAGKIAKGLPIVGSVALAGDAYLNYNNATQNGEDPGRAAFKGIGRVLGNVGGGIGGTAVAGPVGGVAGGMAGGEVGDRVFGKIYDWAGGNSNKPAPRPYTAEEQIAMRERARARNGGSPTANNNNNGSNMMNIAGFQYSPGADTGLVAMRMQQQAQNINAVQGYSTTKHISNNELKSTLGQQYTDRYGIGQLNQTERLRVLQDNMTSRYGIGRQADVENRRTQRDTTLGLGQQYTDRYNTLQGNMTHRYGIGRQADVENRRTQRDTTLGLGQQYTDRYGMNLKAGNERYGLETNRQLGNRDINLKERDLTEGYGLKERERKDKRYMFDQDALLRGRQIENNFAVSGLGIFANMYR